YIFASSVIAHSILAYFIGKNDLLSMTQGTPAANLTYFLLVLFFTSLFAFNFGWFREQFCVIMCPYGRFQALMVDENSRTVQYQAARGEPRRGIDTGSGDCIDCRMCLHACPTGIDIRRGNQMECIACTACIDACNLIMAKVNKPSNLITYGSEDQKPLKLFRPRLMIAMGLWIVLFSAFIFFLWKKSDFFIELIRQKGQPYIVLPSGDIQNQFYLRTINGSTKPHFLKIEINDPVRFELIYPKQDRMIYPQQDLKIPIFVRLKKSVTTKWTQPNISLHFDDHTIVRQIHFIQPEGDLN
ncbi:MAG: 4Fe-4S dicluster domain-containing protein, partial [Pseudobdellovibrionaceae bacterium]